MRAPPICNVVSIHAGHCARAILRAGTRLSFFEINPSIFFFICRIVVSTVVLASINIHFDPCILDEIVALGHIKI